MLGNLLYHERKIKESNIAIKCDNNKKYIIRKGENKKNSLLMKISKTIEKKKSLCYYKYGK